MVENSQQLSKSNQQQEINPITSDDIDEVYRRMSRLYGHAFVSSFGTSDDGTWLMALTGLQKKDLSRGLTALLSYSSDFPPSVPRFKRMCLGITDNHIEERAILLARGGDSYNFDRLPEKDAYFRVRNKREQASDELMVEHLNLAVDGLLENRLDKTPSIEYQDKFHEYRGAI